MYSMYGRVGGGGQTVGPLQNLLGGTTSTIFVRFKIDIRDPEV